jgi:hypothetical protein
MARRKTAYYCPTGYVPAFSQVVLAAFSGVLTPVTDFEIKLCRLSFAVIIYLSSIWVSLYDGQILWKGQ